MQGALFTGAKNSFFMRATQLQKASETVRARIAARRQKFPLTTEVSESVPRLGGAESIAKQVLRGPGQQQFASSSPQRIVASLAAKEPRMNSMKMSVRLMNHLADHEDDLAALKGAIIRQKHECREAEDLLCEQANITARQRADREATVAAIQSQSRQRISEAACQALQKYEASEAPAPIFPQDSAETVSKDRARPVHQASNEEPSQGTSHEGAAEHISKERLAKMETSLSSLENLVYGAAKASLKPPDPSFQEGGALAKARIHLPPPRSEPQQQGYQQLREEASELARRTFPQQEVAGGVLAAIRTSRASAASACAPGAAADLGD